MNLKQIKILRPTQSKYDRDLFADFPVWEITGMDLPELEYQRGKPSPYPDRYHLNITSHIEDTEHFVSVWRRRYRQIVNSINSSKDPGLVQLLNQIWKGEFAHTEINDNIEFTCDAPGFKMETHFDNRNIVAVLIVNLKDNAEGSTHFDQLDYTAPTGKHDGVFFLNHNNTTHSIDWQGDTDRWIAYHTITLFDIMQGNINADTDIG